MTIVAPPLPPGVKSQVGDPQKSWRQKAPARVRREVALRYGGVPDETTPTHCQYCTAEGLIRWVGPSVRFSALTLDHVIPLSRGGSNQHADNFVLACGPCNSSKWNHSLDGWLEGRA